MSENKNCPWCKYNVRADGTSICNQATSCDFRTVPFTKEGILARLHDESIVIEATKKDILNNNLTTGDAERHMDDIIDISHGIAIMSNIAKKEFGASDEELKDRLVSSDFSRWAVAGVLLRMKLNRGGKKNAIKTGK